MLGNNRDRGRIKWTTLMLPEHIVELRNWVDEDVFNERPELTDCDLKLIQGEIYITYKSRCKTLIKTWGFGIILEQQSIVEDIDLRLMTIIIMNTNGIMKIPIKK